MRTGFVLVVALASSAVGCSSGDSSAGGDILALLELAPAPETTEVPVTVTYGDIQAVAELAEVEVPEQVDPGEIAEYMDAVASMDRSEDPSVRTLLPNIAMYPRIEQIDEIDEELGWTVLDVARFVEVNQGAPQVTVMEGAFDRDRLEATLTAGDGDDVLVAGHPDEREPTPARRTGR